MMYQQFKTKHGTTNYRMIKPFLLNEKVRKEGYAHFKSEGYMDLVIEYLGYLDHDGNPIYSMAHYGKQNGDLMCDPDVTFSVDDRKGRILPRSYQNDYLQVYQEVFTRDENGHLLYYPKLLTDIDDFLWTWCKNINVQGFKSTKAE